MPFTSLHIHPSLQKGIRELGFTRPTPVQAEAIPAAMEGRDLLACAQTGSGKTAAFLLPILHRLMDKPRRTTRALILTPTRELAAQILEDFNALAVHTPLAGAAIYGGVSMGPQEHLLQEMLAAGRDPLFVIAEIDKRTAYVGEPVTVTWWLYNAAVVQQWQIAAVPKLVEFWAEELSRNETPERVYIGDVMVRSEEHTS